MTVMKYDLDAIVRPDQELRKVSKTVDFTKIARKYIELKITVGRKNPPRACLLAHFWWGRQAGEGPHVQIRREFGRLCGIKRLRTELKNSKK